MKSSQDTPKGESNPPEKSTGILLLKDIGDATWRMFVPLIVGVVLGLMIDKHMDCSPWALLGGVIVGLAITALLIRNMYKKL